MNNLLNRRPERPLPPGRHERLRAELLDAIDTEETRTPHRKLVPLAAAAAVLAVAAGVAFAIPALKPEDSPQAAGEPQAQPAIRELSAADAAKLRTQCLAEANRITANGIKRPFVDYQVVRAFEFVDVKNPKIVSTWLMGDGKVKFPDDPAGVKVDPIPSYWFCSRTAGGVISESSVRSSKGATMMGSPIHPLARNAGVYAAPVTRVTVQPKGMAPIEALLQGGFWFAPTEGRTNWSPYDEDDPELQNYVVRSYDAAGHELTSSDRPSPPRTTPCPGQGWQPSNPSQPKPTTPQSTSTDPACRIYRWPS
ncbi:hypothetical protein AB0P21_06315 [Kribbella sp. NPDC056861]|uniref:hypothetical protein n=1 Tax=Kribbella sp. NPDC056861 TaxID=3154857 RepID=UPI003430093F